MTRLLFAAAREARIQYLRSDGHWCTTPNPVPRIGPNETYPWRIHPEDEHLQYGPISTILWAWANLEESGAPTELVRATSELMNQIEHDWWSKFENELHRALFLLLVAESLADEGL